MKIPTVFFDIDGTLVSFATHRVPESTLEALAELRRRGVEVVIATGRGAEPIDEIRHVPYSAIIGLNGSECVLDDGRMLFRHTIPEELFERVLDAGERHGFAVAAKFRAGFVVTRVTPRVQAMAERVALPCPPTGDLRELYRSESTGQMCIYADAETERRVMAGLPGLCSSRWCDIFADINLAEVNKGTGIRDYLAYRGYDMAESMSFGDGGNDIPMFRSTGLSVAMGNASDDVKAVADYVTAGVDDDGIRTALTHFGII